MRIIMFLLIVLIVTPVLAQDDSKWCWPANSPYDQCYIGRKYNYYFCFGNQIVEECTEFPNDQPWPYRPLKADLDFLCFEFSGIYPPRIANYPGGIKMPSQSFPEFKISIWQQGREDDCIEDSYASWKCLCPPSQNPHSTICCVVFEYTDNPLYFNKPASMPAQTLLVVNFAACEIDCNSTTVYLNVSDDYTNYDPAGYPDTPFETFFYTTGGYPPNIYSGPDANYRVVYLCDVIRHEIGHNLGLAHHDDCGHQGPNNRVNSGIMNIAGVQTNAPPASFTQDDVCAYRRLYCPDVVTHAGNSGSLQETSAVVEENYPNPFTTTTVIPFTLAIPGHVQLVVYNNAGHIVRVLADTYMFAGSYEEKFDSQSLPPGTYWYVVQFNGEVLSRKMLLVR